MNPLVSIQIPTYNQKQYIKEAIDSALAQTYDNLQIIISDDCSTDYDIFEYLKDYTDNPKLLIHRNEKNLGRVGNYRNTLYNLVEGDWFVNLDGDDYFINSSYIETAIRYLNKVEDAVLFQAEAWIPQIINGKIKGEEIGKDTFFVDSNDYIRNFQHSLGFTHASVVYNVRIAKSLNFYNFNILDIDNFSYLRMLTKGNLIIWKEKVYIWRQHNNQETRFLDFQEVYNKYDVLKDLRKYYKNIPDQNLIAVKDYNLYLDLLSYFSKVPFSLKRFFLLVSKTRFRTSYIISALSVLKNMVLKGSEYKR